MFDSPIQNSATQVKNTDIEFNNGYSETIPCKQKSIFKDFSTVPFAAF